DALGRELDPPFAPVEEARPLEDQDDLTEPLEVARRRVPEERAELLERDRAEIAALQILLEAPEPLELAHQLERFLVFEADRAAEAIAARPTELLELPDVVELLEEPGEVALGLGVLEAVRLRDPLDRLGEPPRPVVEERALLARERPVALALEAAGRLPLARKGRAEPPVR